jgi:hypothetical protein
MNKSKITDRWFLNEKEYKLPRVIKNLNANEGIELRQIVLLILWERCNKSDKPAYGSKIWRDFINEYKRISGRDNPGTSGGIGFQTNLCRSHTKLERGKIYDIIRILHYSFGMHFKRFIPLSKSKYIEGDVQQITNDISSESTFVDMRKSNINYKIEYEKYKTSFQELIQNAKKEILIYDYLGRGTRDFPGIQLKEYFNKVGQICNSIQDHPNLKSSYGDDFIYVRILALPKFYTTSNKNLLNLVLQHCSVELFDHICYCLMFDKLSKTGFYITDVPSRNYLFSIIDDYICHEVYMLDENGEAIPSYATFRNSNKHHELGEMLDIYRNEIKLHKRNKLKINSKEFKHEFIHVLKEFYELEKEIISKSSSSKPSNIEIPPKQKHWDDLVEVINRKLKSFNNLFHLKERKLKSFSDINMQKI